MKFERAKNGVSANETEEPVKIGLHFLGDGSVVVFASKGEYPDTWLITIEPNGSIRKASIDHDKRTNMGFKYGEELK